MATIEELLEAVFYIQSVPRIYTGSPDRELDEAEQVSDWWIV
jgi:hypothetical protein